LFVPGDDQVDRRAAKALNESEILLARHAENAFDALVLERRGK